MVPDLHGPRGGLPARLQPLQADLPLTSARGPALVSATTSARWARLNRQFGFFLGGGGILIRCHNCRWRLGGGGGGGVTPEDELLCYLPEAWLHRSLGDDEGLV